MIRAIEMRIAEANEAKRCGDMSNDDITFLQMWEELNDNDRQRTELSEALARIEKSHQAMKEALEATLYSIRSLDEEYDLRESYVKGMRALTLANGKDS